MKDLPTVKKDVKSLPSRGVSYPENVEFVEYRVLTFGEMQKLSASKNLTEKDLIEISMEGITVKGMNKYLLTYSDYQYILLARKLSMSQSGEHQMRYKHPFTNKTAEFNFKTEDIKFKDMRAEKLPVNLKLSDTMELKFSPLTVQDIMIVLQDNKMDDEIAVIARTVRNHNFNSAYSILQNIHNDDDIQDLKRVSKYLEHGMEPFEVKCTDNKSDRTKTVRLAPDRRLVHLIPFRGGNTASKDRISFGD